MLFSKKAREVLEHFCSFPLDSSIEVLKEFAKLPGAISCFDEEKKNFVYIPGERSDRVLLVAHADTVWDKEYTNFEKISQSIIRKRNTYIGTNEEYGIGADDRAGCAILWMLKDSGHSLLVTDGEEHGQIGANHIRHSYPDLFEELNNHSYMIQFDRRGADDYKFYNIPVSEKFENFIKSKTRYRNAGTNARTDIVALCEKICSVNLSVGYYNEHTQNEYIIFKNWFHTFKIVKKLLEEKQQQYKLIKKQ